MRCPVCTQTLDNGELIMVCSACHRHLGSGGLAPNATGEFRVPTTEELAMDASGPIERPISTNVCSWCGKLEREVKKLLGRNDVALCDECVSLAHDIMEAELGSNWRS